MERLEAVLMYCKLRNAGTVSYRDRGRYEEHLGIWTAISYNTGGIRWI